MPRIFPVYLFTGDDDFLKREAVQKLKKALLGAEKSEAFDFDVYEVGTCDIQKVIGLLRSHPFVSEKRLVVLKGVDRASKGEQKTLIEYTKNPSVNACLLLESSGREFSNAFYRKLVTHAREISFVLPKGNNIVPWICKEVKKCGKSIRHDAAVLLKELKEGDTPVLRNEIDKLVTYVDGRSVLTREDVEKLVGGSVSHSVFEFVDALSRRNAKEALAAAKELFETKKAIPEILGMIGWHFRRIKKAQRLLEQGASGRKASVRCNVPPFYIERFIKEIRSFRKGEIKKNIARLVDTDYSIKRGLLKPYDALQLFIVEVCSRR